MTYLKIMFWIVTGYSGVVLLAEALVWRLQPSMENATEHASVSNAYNMGFVLRLICGFAPSRFLRLESSSGLVGSGDRYES